PIARKNVPPVHKIVATRFIQMCAFRLPHLMRDCSDISQRRFRVLEPDPHGFDRDNDGIGCER
ncbi:hypothetical protein Q5692_30125, partial [Microcoleus sp. C2C3]